MSAVAPWRWSAGQTIDSFEVLRPLGRGGMAEVYLARDVVLGRLVALKWIRADALGDDPGAVERFLAEARLTARFSHPNIVTVHAAGTHGGEPYVVLEYVEGETLRARLDPRPALKEALRLARAIAAALVEAHAHGILHRDLKPENVMIGRDGRLRVLDFGLARRFADRADDAASDQPSFLQSTRASVEGSALAGTPAYMAPEQWERRAVGPAADVWALGVILFELVAGARPFAGEDQLALALAVCADAPPPRPAAPTAVAELVHRCLAKDPSLRPSAAEVERALADLLDPAPALEGPGPFRGLLPFDREHAALFFGRRAEIDAVAERLRHEALVVVVGPSGVGKSSFVRAGLLPRLEERGPSTAVVVRPGRDPFLALARALPGPPDGVAGLAARLAEVPERVSLALAEAAPPGGQVVWVVDQLEELFGLVESAEVRRRFVRALTAAGRDPCTPIRVLATVREEFLGRLAELDEDRVLGRAIEVLGPPGPASLRVALVEPVARAGYRFDPPELPDRVVAELAGELACLPLLQFAAQRLWEERDVEGRRLLGAAYDALGGVAGALARHADAVLAALTPAELGVARTILLRLVTPDDTRRVLGRAAAIDGLGPAAGGVLDRLVDARLVTARQLADATEVELAHESLIATWARLRRWIDEHRGDRVVLDQLDQAASLWERRGRRLDEAWEGEALGEATRVVAQSTVELPTAVRSFVAAGEAKAAARRRRGRLLRGGAIAALALVAVGASLAALGLRAKEQRAREQAALARTQEAAAFLEGARAAAEEGDPLQARGKLRVSMELADGLAARAAFGELGAEPLRWRRSLGGVVCGAFVFAPDGRTLASACIDRTILLLDVDTGESVGLRTPGERATQLDYSPDGRALVSVDLVGAVHLWDLARGTSRELLPADGALSAGVRHLGDRVLRSTGRGVGELLLEPDTDASGPRDRSSPAPGEARQERWRAVERFHPPGDFALVLDGALGLVRGGETTLRPSGQAPRVVPAPGPGVVPTVLRRLGDRVWIGFSDGRLEGHSLAGEAPLALVGHGAPIRAVAALADGRLLSSSADQTLRVWDLARGTHEVVTRELSVFSQVAAHGARVAFFTRHGLELHDFSRRAAGLGPEGHAEPSYAALFLGAGERLVTSGHEGALIVWDVASGRPLRRLGDHRGWVYGLAASADGRWVVSASVDRTLRRWSTETWASQVLYEADAPLYGVSIRADGKVAWTAQNGRIGTVDLASGAARSAPKHLGMTLAVEFLPDGTIATGGHDTKLYVSDPDTLATLATHELGDLSTDLAIAPNRRDAAIGAWTRTFAWPELRDPVPIPGIPRISGVAYLPDGRLVSAHGDGLVRLWSSAFEAVATFGGHDEEANFVAVDPAGRLLATTSDDRHVRLFDLQSTRPIWRAPLLLLDPPRLLSHRGLEDLADGRAAPPEAAWLRAADRATLAVRSEDGRVACLAGVALEVWDPVADRLVRTLPLRAAADLVATADGCLVLAEGALFDAAGVRTASAAVAVSAAEPRWVVGGGRAVRLDGARPPVAVRPDVRAILERGGLLVLGHADGRLEARSLSGGPAPVFDRGGAARITRLAAGPAGTVIAGGADGFVGVFELATGRRLSSFRLHGIVRHLAFAGDRLHAASELGSHASRDLSALTRPRCALLREVWAEIPFVWRDGRATRASPPPDHPCATP